MATPGGGSLRVYDNDLLEEMIGTPKVRPTSIPRLSHRLRRSSAIVAIPNRGSPRRILGALRFSSRAERSCLRAPPPRRTATHPPNARKSRPHTETATEPRRLQASQVVR